MLPRPEQPRYLYLGARYIHTCVSSPHFSSFPNTREMNIFLMPYWRVGTCLGTYHILISH